MGRNIALFGIALLGFACSSSSEKASAATSTGGTSGTHGADAGNAGGTQSGTGGTQSGTGGTQSGTGGTQSGTGGTQSGTGGTQSGTGGAQSGTGGRIGSGGAAGNAGTSHGGSGAGASGGTSGGGGKSSDVSGCQDTVNGPSHVQFNISLGDGLTPDQICIDTCSAYSMSIKDANGATLNPGLSGTCGSRPCISCQTFDCPGSMPPVCTRMSFSSSYATALWTGSYYTMGGCAGCTSPGCGPALACQDYACAPDGHYTATFCFPRTMAGSGSTCTQSSQKACATVEFDLPGVKVVPVVIK